MYMLDTNIVIYAMKHPKGAIMDKLLAHTAVDLCISTVTYAELLIGVEKSAYSERNKALLTRFLFGVEIMDFDQEAAQHYANIKVALQRQGMPVGDLDMMIAGHARSMGCVVVTNNRKHFDRIEGIVIEDWLNESRG